MLPEGFKSEIEHVQMCKTSLYSGHCILQWGAVWGGGKLKKSGRKLVELSCRDIRRELVNYMEDDLSAEKRKEIEAHISKCAHCTAVYDGARNTMALVAVSGSLELPPGLSKKIAELLNFHRT